MTFVYQQRASLLFVLQAFLCGVSLGGLYDASRLFRMAIGVSRFSSKEPSFAHRMFPLIGKLKRTKRKEGRIAATVLFVCDLAFMLIAACALLCVLFFRNDGRFRWVVLLFTGGGFLSYYVSIGYLVIRFGAVIICLLRIFSAYTVFFITYPIKYAWKLIHRAFCCLASETICRVRAIRIKKEAPGEYDRLLFGAKEGFLWDGRRASPYAKDSLTNQNKQDEKTKEDSKNVRIRKKLFGRLGRGPQKV